jgi:hypothetical protein
MDTKPLVSHTVVPCTCTIGLGFLYVKYHSTLATLDTCLLDNQLILRISFWEIIYSQIFHQILYFPSEKIYFWFFWKTSTFLKIMQLMWNWPMYYTTVINLGYGAQWGSAIIGLFRAMRCANHGTNVNWWRQTISIGCRSNRFSYLYHVCTFWKLGFVANPV